MTEYIYYWNAYDEGAAWRNNPENLVDGDPDTYASTIDVDARQRLTENTYENDTGTITKVEIMVRGYHIFGTDGYITLIPQFRGGEPGDEHDFITTTTPSDSDWFDITDDTNAPGSGNWTWDDVRELQIDVRATALAGFRQVFASIVKMRVTIEIGVTTSITNINPPSGSKNVKFTSAGVFCSFLPDDTEKRDLWASAAVFIKNNWDYEKISNPIASDVNRYVQFRKLNEPNSEYLCKLSIGIWGGDGSNDLTEEFKLTTGDYQEYDFLSPSSFEDPSGSWVNESYAFDNKTDTWSYTTSPTDYLYLHTSKKMWCDGIHLVSLDLSRYKEGNATISLSVNNNGSWEDIYNGTVLCNIPTSIPIPGGKYIISSARIKITNAGSPAGEWGELWEFHFKVYPGPGDELSIRPQTIGSELNIDNRSNNNEMYIMTSYS